VIMSPVPTGQEAGWAPSRCEQSGGEVKKRVSFKD
jgi:hypothetical protein